MRGRLIACPTLGGVSIDVAYIAYTCSTGAVFSIGVTRVLHPVDVLKNTWAAVGVCALIHIRNAHHRGPTNDSIQMDLHPTAFPLHV